MTEREEMESNGYVVIGNTTPGAPVGKIYASKTMVAQVPAERLKEEVRNLYAAIYSRSKRAI